MKQATSFVSIFIFALAGAAFSKAIPVRLEGMLWEVDCRGIVTTPIVGASGAMIPGNINVANPGNEYTAIARKAYKAVCGRNYE